jgi:hypothetical protein
METTNHVKRLINTSKKSVPFLLKLQDENKLVEVDTSQEGVKIRKGRKRKASTIIRRT